jgi:hypothetical protein
MGTDRREGYDVVLQDSQAVMYGGDTDDRNGRLGGANGN